VIILPRQARDKHRKNSQKRTRLCRFAPNAAAGSDGTGRPISEVGPGIPNEFEYKAKYEELTGAAVPESTWKFLQAFQVFRLAAIGHGVFARGLQGNASSSKALRQGWRAATAKEMLIELGLEPPRESKL
jgi:aminoglycoside phosphotransferase (APT) family kinase protein